MTDRHGRVERRGWVSRLASDLITVAREEKKWWLLPLLILLVVLAGVLLLAAFAGPLAPFFYPLL
jgi:hypothetical protein